MAQDGSASEHLIHLKYKALDPKRKKLVKGIITLSRKSEEEAKGVAQEKLTSMGFKVLKVRRLNRFQLWLMLKWHQMPNLD